MTHVPEYRTSVRTSSTQCKQDIYQLQCYYNMYNGTYKMLTNTDSFNITTECEHFLSFK